MKTDKVYNNIASVLPIAIKICIENCQTLSLSLLFNYNLFSKGV